MAKYKAKTKECIAKHVRMKKIQGDLILHDASALDLANVGKLRPNGKGHIK